MLFCKIFVVKKFSFAQKFYTKWLICIIIAIQLIHIVIAMISLGFLEVNDVDRFSEAVWLFKCLIDST